MATLPQVGGDLDAAYVREALARAGRDAAVSEVSARPLTDGRSGAVVTALVLDGGRRLVHKAVRDGVGFHAVVGGPLGREAALFRSDVTARLPGALTWPIFDAARHDGRGETWLLMDDVSEGILPPGAFDPAKLDRMLAGVAALHAGHWGRADALDALPLLELGEVARLFGDPVLACARGTPPRDAWVRWMIESFVVGRYLPRFLEILGARGADDYLAIVESRDAWIAALARHEPTLLHNDLRRANLSYLADGRVALLDWERAARGPAAVDLTWLWFLQFWAYPPRAPHDPDAHRAAYLFALERALGRPVDREAFAASWGLGWVLVLCEIGYLLADVLVESPDLPPDEAAARVRRAHEALDLARRAVDRA
jgi:hypothetical protein